MNSMKDSQSIDDEQDEGQSVDRQIADIFSVEDLRVLQSLVYQMRATFVWVSEMIMTEYLGTVTLQACAFMNIWSLLIESFIFGGRGLTVLLMD